MNLFTTTFTATPLLDGVPERYKIKVEDNNGSDEVIVVAKVMDDQEALDRVVADMVRKRNELEEKRRDAQEKVIKAAKHNIELLKQESI